MPTLIEQPTVIEGAGNKPKRIEEYAGRVASAHGQVSVARMQSPPGWQEPGQAPDFEEITVVLKGRVQVEHANGILEVKAGQAVVTAPGEGFDTARRKEPNTSRCVFPPSLRRRSTETRTEFNCRIASSPMSGWKRWIHSMAQKAEETGPVGGSSRDPAGVETSSSTEILEGRDFYWENGLVVMTAEFLRRRGYCCESGCRHCPYAAKAGA